MALTYIPKTKLLYSGATNYNIYVWDIKERKIKETLSGHPTTHPLNPAHSLTHTF